MIITEDDFYTIIQNTWNSTLGFDVDRADAAPRSGDSELVVSTRVSGAWNGEVRMRCSRALGSKIAAAFFQVDAGNTGNDQVLDALSELIHIVGGNLKALLPQPITLSLPSTENPEVSSMPQASETVCHLALSSSGHPFTVSLEATQPSERIEPLAASRRAQIHAERP
jgi:chemotaxis protein CheX